MGRFTCSQILQGIANSAENKLKSLSIAGSFEKRLGLSVEYLGIPVRVILVFFGLWTTCCYYLKELPVIKPFRELIVNST